MEKKQEKKQKRRPGRENNIPSNADVKVVDVETGETSGGDAVHESAPQVEQVSSPSGDRIEIKFTGSELIRAKFPKPFEVAEIIASDWIHGGRFEGLPLGHPLAQYFAAKGLRKAKEMETKVLESPVTEKIAMQALTAGMKAQEIISQVREKIKK